MTERTCNGCIVCCEVYYIKELRKPGYVRCEHCSPDKSRPGCSIYDERPPECQKYVCFWIECKSWPDFMWPKTSGIVVQSTIAEDGSVAFSVNLTGQGVKNWTRNRYRRPLMGLYKQTRTLNPEKLVLLRVGGPNGRQVAYDEILDKFVSINSACFFLGYPSGMPIFTGTNEQVEEMDDLVQAASDNLCVLSEAKKIQAAYDLARKCGLENPVEGESIIG